MVTKKLILSLLHVQAERVEAMSVFKAFVDTAQQEWVAQEAARRPSVARYKVRGAVTALLLRGDGAGGAVGSVEAVVVSGSGRPSPGWGMLGVMVESQSGGQQGSMDKQKRNWVGKVPATSWAVCGLLAMPRERLGAN
jgi:hypothetical protein